jgi:hypothetical protein
MSNNQAGKGDKPRPIIKRAYDNNFDQIVWKRSEEKESASKKGKKTYKY